MSSLTLKYLCLFLLGKGSQKIWKFLMAFAIKRRTPPPVIGTNFHPFLPHFLLLQLNLTYMKRILHLVSVMTGQDKLTVRVDPTPCGQLFVNFLVCAKNRFFLSKNTFLRPYQWVKIFTFAYGQGRGG